MQQELFLCDEVLHMNVDNLVESRACGRVNSAKFNTMIRIAHFWCNARRFRLKQGNSSACCYENHGLVGRKAQFFEWKEFQNGKLLQMNGRKEKAPVEHSRETSLTASSANFSTTSAGDQDES